MKNQKNKIEIGDNVAFVIIIVAMLVFGILIKIYE